MGKKKVKVTVEIQEVEDQEQEEVSTEVGQIGFTYGETEDIMEDDDEEEEGEYKAYGL